MNMTGSQQAKYHGLENQGATCYLNSVLQVLFMTGQFREKVKSYRITNAGTEPIDRELRELFKSLEKKYAHTQQITEKLKIHNVREHRDAAEHYEKILRLTSPGASEIFHGRLINRNKCCQCREVTESPAGFWHLPLPLVSVNSEYSVKKGLKDFFKSSTISGVDQMYCEKCDKKCDAVLDCVVEHCPEVLVLLLKRFEIIYVGNSVRKVKIDCSVKIPYSLKMDTRQKQTIRYELYAFVEHFGDLQYGHYTAKIKPLNDGPWYIFDDLNVKKSDFQHFQLDDRETSKNVYLLFYQQQKGDTNKAQPDTVTNGTNATHSTEEEGKNKTEANSAFSKGFGAEDKPVRPSLKRGAISDPEVQHPRVRYSNDKMRQSKHVKDKTNKIHEPSQDGRDRRFEENVNQHEVSYNSTCQNRTHEDTIKKPVETEETSERNKQLRQDFDRRVKGRDASRSRTPLSSIQWKQSTQAGHQSGQASPVKSKGEQRHVPQHLDLGLGESRQNYVQVHPAANRCDAVQRSQSFAPTQSSSSMHRNGTRHHYMSETEHRMRSEERSVPSGEWDRGRPESERIGHIMLKERHCFHGQHQKYPSQDYQLEKFRGEMERNYEGTEKEITGTQNYNYKEKRVLHSHRVVVVHSKPSVEKPQPYRTPQQCLETAEQKNMISSQLSSRESPQSGRSQRPRSGHGDGFTTGRAIEAPHHKSKAKESTNYSPPYERRFRNQPYGNTKREEEITAESLDEVNNLTSKNTTKGQTLKQDRKEIVLDTNDQKPEKKKKKINWSELFCIPLKRKHSK